MKIYIDDELIFEISESKKNVIKNDIPEEEFDEDIKRRLFHIIDHKYSRCLKRLKDEWLPKLKENGVKDVPLDDDAFSELVFAQKEYKNRSKRDIEEKERKAKQREKIEENKSL